MSDVALVTGATGLLGSYLVERLLEDGWGVRALVRHPEQARWLEEAGAKLFAGDITDRPSITSAASGCSLVFHAAASVGVGNDWETFRLGNVEGTENVLHASAASGARFVFVSTTGVFGRARYREIPTDESVPLPKLPEHEVYGRSKQAAERLVLEAHERGTAWTAIVRSPVMYGVRDRQFVPRIAPILQRGFFPLLGGGTSTMSLTHARSIAEGALLVGTNESAGGKIYHLTDDFPITVSDLVRYGAEGLGCRVRRVHVPTAVAKIGFGVLKPLLVAIGRSDLAPHTEGTLDMLTRNNPFTSRRAREELGWVPTTRPEAGLPEAFRSWKARATSSLDTSCS
ncbi:MAG: NAD-dependent epimerase/dehydratase family protein [Gemmatimonadetes bacterium]|nr:NAD-dependent epimerase/dehydratase family protein [Gemmatimonadota bacterium]